MVGQEFLAAESLIASVLLHGAEVRGDLLALGVRPRDHVPAAKQKLDHTCDLRLNEANCSQPVTDVVKLRIIIIIF